MSDRDVRVTMPADKRRIVNVAPAAAHTSAPGVFAAWTVPLVRAALLEHEQGIFTTSSILVDAMYRDDRIFTALKSRILAALSLPVLTDASTDTGGDPALDELAASLATRVESWWYAQFPESVWSEVLKWILMMGFAVGELTYEPWGAEWRPRLHVHHLGAVEWREHEDCFYLRLSDGTAVKITPGDGRWVLFAPFGAKRPWLDGAVRALAIPFLIRAFATRDWARRSEIEGLGIKRARVPRNAVDATVKAFLEDVRKLGSESSIRLPEGYDLDFLTTTQSEGGADGFSKLIGHGNDAITLTLLGQNLTTQVSGGSFAAATVHEGVAFTRVKADVATIATATRPQMVVPWGRLNVPGFDDRLAPWPRWDTTSPDDLKQYSAALQSIAQAIPALREAGVDIAPIVERAGLKMLPASGNVGNPQ